ncbi:hypothetical protein ONE63_011167 [Megalurothrips usitatus]|uniref:Uncharacterized protein n=1 Tax=Megalurothrips usitatus TaxID=439358 RepID=A0AAV7X375_9NEOP|nr:hypothetical protein ONE63_011167 [Megalurothrips usitatus]
MRISSDDNGIIFSIPLASAAGVILYEKNDGILNRSLVLGMTMRDVLLSHIITQAVLMVPVITVVLVSFLDLVKIHNSGPLEWVVLLCVLQGFCGLCLGEIGTL